MSVYFRSQDGGLPRLNALLLGIFLVTSTQIIAGTPNPDESDNASYTEEITTIGHRTSGGGGIGFLPTGRDQALGDLNSNVRNSISIGGGVDSAKSDDNKQNDCTKTAANPVTIATGEKTEIEYDFIGAEDFPLNITRHYSSKRTGGAFGAGWSSALDRHLITNISGQITAVRANGSALPLDATSASVWTAEAASVLRELRKLLGSYWESRVGCDSVRGFFRR